MGLEYVTLRGRYWVPGLKVVGSCCSSHSLRGSPVLLRRRLRSLSVCLRAMVEVLWVRRPGFAVPERPERHLRETPYLYRA